MTQGAVFFFFPFSSWMPDGEIAARYTGAGGGREFHILGLKSQYITACFSKRYVNQPVIKCETIRLQFFFPWKNSINLFFIHDLLKIWMKAVYICAFAIELWLITEAKGTIMFCFHTTCPLLIEKNKHEISHYRWITFSALYSLFGLLYYLDYVSGLARWTRTGNES